MDKKVSSDSYNEKKTPLLKREFTFHEPENISPINETIAIDGIDKLKNENYFAWKLADFFCRFEDFTKEKASFCYASLFVMIITIFFKIESYFDVNFSILEFSFIGFLWCFLINYYFIRKSDIYPYIENTAHNTEAKLSGIAFLCSLILIVYSIQTAACHFAILLYFLSFLFSFALEKYMYHDSPQD